MQELSKTSILLLSHDELEEFVMNDNMLMDTEEIEVDRDSTKYCAN